MEEKIVHITVVDRHGVNHELEAPTDMNMNMMELCKSYELPVEGTCGGMAMCASCHMYVMSDHDLLARNDDEEACWIKLFLSNLIVVWAVKCTYRKRLMVW